MSLDDPAMPTVTGTFLDPSYVLVVDRGRTVSISGSGGGPSGGELGTAPDAATSSTPPSPSLTETADPDGEFEKPSDECEESVYESVSESDSGSIVSTRECSTQTDAFCVSSFSSKTCLEMLETLTPEQLEYELRYFKSLGCDIPIRGKASKFQSASIQRELDKLLKSQTCNDLSSLAGRFDSLTNSFSFLVERAQAEVDKLRRPLSVPVTVSPSKSEELVDPVLSPLPSPDLEVMSELPNSVCFLHSIKFDDFTVTRVLEQINIAGHSTCGKKTVYFGDLPYSYGEVHHEPQPYPADSDVFDTMFDRIKSVDPNFTRSNYTCLVTLYPDGHAYIPKHGDNETQIMAHTPIYTVSVGAPRTLRFINSDGLVHESDVLLEHGSLYSMCSSTQSAWSHSIERDFRVREPRVSFTFRRIVPEPVVEPGVRVPPIRPPEPVKPSIARGSHRRILFLTDSVLKHTPEHIFNRVGDYRCIKKVNYELANIFGFEPEFAYSDIVVISCGVNDLARYGRRAHVLADVVTKRLEECCKRHRATTFVFTSVLSTGHVWLNAAVGEFNKIMFELSMRVPNMAFFDSHSVVLGNSISSPSSRVTVIRPGDDGIHISFEARKLISDQLVNGVELLARRREGLTASGRLQGWQWPLRPSYSHMARSMPARLAHRGAG